MLSSAVLRFPAHESLLFVYCHDVVWLPSLLQTVQPCLHAIPGACAVAHASRVAAKHHRDACAVASVASVSCVQADCGAVMKHLPDTGCAWDSTEQHPAVCVCV